MIIIKQMTPKAKNHVLDDRKRKCLAILLCCTLMITCTISAYATGTTEYALDELGMTVFVPSDYIVFTRDIDEDDPNLALYGLSKDSVLSFLDDGHIYLNGWDEAINQEIIVTMMNSPFKDLNLFSDTALLGMETDFKSVYNMTGATIIKSEVYQHSQAKFLKMYLSRPLGDTTAYGLQYLTSYADKAISITLQSYSGQITASEEAIIKSIVDSAIFDTAPQTMEPDPTPTSSFAVSDSRSVVNNNNGLISQFSLGNILLNLLVTIIVYSLPIIVYRYAIRKAPVDRKRAKKITIIYGVCAFVVMSVLVFTINSNGAASGAILLWSWVNYGILIGGKNSKENLLERPKEDADSIIPEPCYSPENIKRIAPDSIPNNPEPIETQDYSETNAEQDNSEFVSSETEIQYCYRCGNKLQPDCLFCNKCGAKVPQ